MLPIVVLNIPEYSVQPCLRARTIFGWKRHQVGCTRVGMDGEVDRVQGVAWPCIVYPPTFLDTVLPKYSNPVHLVGPKIPSKRKRSARGDGGNEGRMPQLKLQRWYAACISNLRTLSETDTREHSRLHGCFCGREQSRRRHVALDCHIPTPGVIHRHPSAEPTSQCC